jgi:5-methylcytosine-specific restriction endonuclease McrA
MKYLKPSRSFDGRRLKNAFSKLAKLQKHLPVDLAEIRDQYALYIKNKGNPWNIPSFQVSNKLKIDLKHYFNNPSRDFDYIPVLRDLSPDLCPTCGAPCNPGQLDHYMPRERYPAFTVLSWNLVPACNCNQKKGDQTVGDLAAAERFLHPYYDRFLLERLYSASIVGQDFPKVEINIVQIYYSPSSDGPVKYHLDELIKKTKILNTMDRRWGAFYNNPRSIVTSLPKYNLLISIEDFVECVQDQLDQLDDKYDTKNNWESIFVHGLLKATSLHLEFVGLYNSLVK